MCSTGASAACVQSALEVFTRTSEACAASTARVVAFLQALPSPCTNATSAAALRAGFRRGGPMRAWLECAVRADASAALYAGAFDPHLLHAFLCADSAAPAVAAVDAEAAGASVGARAATGGSVLVLALAAAGWVAKHGVKKARRRRGTIHAWWLLLFCACMPLSWHLDRSVAPDDFFVRDEVTACAFEVQRRLPETVAKDYVVSVLVPARDALEAYGAVLERARFAPAAGAPNASLAELCGGCGMLAWNRTATPSAPLMRALLLADAGEVRAAGGTDDVGFSVRVPTWVPRAGRARLAAAARAALPASAAFVSSEQAVADSQASAQPEWPLVLGSALLLAAVAGVAARAYVTKGALGAVLSLAMMLGGVVVVADAATAVLGVPFSPFNVMGFPLVLGTGVDAFFLLLHRRAAGGRDWVETAMPSIVASQLSTATCFLIGAAIPVPHVRYFFVYMLACTLVSLALQATWVPALVVVGTRVRAAEPDKRARPARRGAACLAVLAVACLWAVLLQYRQPVGRAFDMRKQLRDDTPTHQFLVRADAMTPTPTSFVYAYTRGLEHDWPALDEAALGTGCVREPRSLSWHAVLPPGVGVREWLADARASFAYRAFVDADANVSVALYTAAHDMGVDADRSHAELACLARAAAGTPTCYASYERMGGYTVVELCRELVFLAAMSCVVATAFAVGVARGRGLLALVALALSYGGGVAVIGAMRLPIDMLLIAVMLIAPGLLVDFFMHLVVHRDAAFAVAASAATSIASALPYMGMGVESVRHFALVYCLFLALGMLHSFALVAAGDLIAYHAVATDETAALAAA